MPAYLNHDRELCATGAETAGQNAAAPLPHVTRRHFEEAHELVRIGASGMSISTTAKTLRPQTPTVETENKRLGV